MTAPRTRSSSPRPHLILKTELPPDLFARTGPSKLVLITCGGEFDRSVRRYKQNVVVVATPAP